MFFKMCCIFWQIVWVHMLLRCSQLVVTSAMSSSSQDCAGCHNEAVEHMIVNILIISLNVQKKLTSFLSKSTTLKIYIKKIQMLKWLWLVVWKFFFFLFSKCFKFSSVFQFFFCPFWCWWVSPFCCLFSLSCKRLSLPLSFVTSLWF